MFFSYCRNRKRQLDDEGIDTLLRKINCEDEFIDSESSEDDSIDDPNYEECENEVDQSDFDDIDEPSEPQHKRGRILVQQQDVSGVCVGNEQSNISLEDEETMNGADDHQMPVEWTESVTDIDWSKLPQEFEPLFSLSAAKRGVVLCSLDRSSTPFEAFKSVFPPSLFIHIADKTNKRIEKENASKKVKNNLTDAGEVMIVIGCTMIMGYNKVPKLELYWSGNRSLRNECISKAITRDRFRFVFSKMYFADPQKPSDASKTYYIDDVVRCFKYTFAKSFSESNRQSIDESMTKFKGRSALKQYLPMKPIKRGIKIWQRCDAITGYTYDFNIYSGKDLSQNRELSLGEKVVTKLCSTMRSKESAMCFDRFFSSVKLFANLGIPAVGTYMSNRKYTPDLTESLERGETEAKFSDKGVMALKWQDSKPVHMMSNCHSFSIKTARRTSKSGEKNEISCPEAVIFYNDYMAGVDKSDQYVASYNFERKSKKWWKKVFFKLTKTALVNAWILHKEVKCRNLPQLPFIINTAEDMITHGVKCTSMIRNHRVGRPSSSPNLDIRLNIGKHFPQKVATRRRCKHCANHGKEKRGVLICSSCKVPLCGECFEPYHK